MGLDEEGGGTVTDRTTFFQSYQVVGDCWLWTRAKNTNGYGYVCFEKQFYRTHILSYMLAHGLTERPVGVVMHTCDTPSCINPEHLVLGTQEENSRDKSHKGRWRGKDGAKKCNFIPGSHSDARRQKLTEDARRRRKEARENKCQKLHS